MAPRKRAQRMPCYAAGHTAEQRKEHERTQRIEQGNTPDRPKHIVAADQSAIYRPHNFLLSSARNYPSPGKDIRNINSLMTLACPPARGRGRRWAVKGLFHAPPLPPRPHSLRPPSG